VTVAVLRVHRREGGALPHPLSLCRLTETTARPRSSSRGTRPALTSLTYPRPHAYAGQIPGVGRVWRLSLLSCRLRTTGERQHDEEHGEPLM